MPSLNEGLALSSPTEDSTTARPGSRLSTICHTLSGSFYRSLANRALPGILGVIPKAAGSTNGLTDCIGAPRRIPEFLLSSGSTTSVEFSETGLGNAPYPQIRPGETLAHCLVEIHIHGIDELGRASNVMLHNPSGIRFTHIPGYKPSWDSHETAVEPR